MDHISIYIYVIHNYKYVSNCSHKWMCTWHHIVLYGKTMGRISPDLADHGNPIVSQTLDAKAPPMAMKSLMK